MNSASLSYAINDQRFQANEIENTSGLYLLQEAPIEKLNKKTLFI